MLAKITFIVLFLSIYNVHAVECIKDPRFYFSNDGVKRYGNITVYNQYKNGECSFRITMTRTTDTGRKIEEQFSFSDQGKLTTFLGSPVSFATSTNSRATGSRAYYLFPRKKENISYDINSNGDLVVHMTNGEDAIFSTKQAALKNITNTKWRRNKALRSYIRNGKVIAEDVYAESCMNCSLKYKIKYDKFLYSQGGLVIDSVGTGIVMSTPFVRGKDSRLPTQWGNKIKGSFKDNRGNICSIANQYLYDYEYEQFGSRRSIDKIHFKFPTDFSKSKTRVGEENIQEFLKRVCIKQKGIKKFNLDFYSNDGNCENCKNTLQDSLPDETKSIKQLFEAIDTNLIKTDSSSNSKQESPDQQEDKYSVQKGAFKSKDNAKKLYHKEIEEGNHCEIRVLKPFYKVFCIN